MPLDALELLSEELGETAESPSPRSPSLLPLTEAEVKKNLEKYNQQKLVKSPRLSEDRDLDFLKRNRDPGVDFDIESGLGFLDRLNLSFRADPMDKVAFLQEKYGKENVRLADGDESKLIVRQSDESGKPRDILTDERGLSFSDAIEFLPAIGEGLAAAVGVGAGRKIPKIGQLKGAAGAVRDIFAGTVAYEGTRGAEEITTDILDQGRADVGKIATERASAIPGGVVMEGAMLGTAKLGGRVLDAVVAPGSFSRSEIQNEAMGARGRIAQETKIDLPMTAGESTGSPLISRIEGYVQSQNSGTFPMERFREAQDEMVRRFQKYMFGGVESDTEVGEAAIRRLQGIRDTAEQQTRLSASQLNEEATKGILNRISKLTIPQAQLYDDEVGNAVRGKVLSLRQEARSESDRLYGIAKAEFGGTGSVFDGAGLAKAAQGIKDSLPSPERIVTQATGLVGPNGNPLTRTEVTKEISKEFVPPNILARLNELASNKTAKYSLSDYQQMRREVLDDIAKAEALPGYGVKYLGQIGKAITQAIDDGVSSLPKGNLKTALKTANDHYKKDVLKFGEAGIGDIFPEISDPGFKEGFQIARRLVEDPAKYDRTMAIIGKGSPEAKLLKRRIADDLIGRSMLDGAGKTIDGTTFYKNLVTFREKNRKVYDDVFGKGAAELYDLAKVGEFSKRVQEFSTQEMRELIDTAPKGMAKKIRDLAAKRELEKELYRNNIVKKFTTGQLDTNRINPAEFVDKFLGSDIAPKDVNQVMSFMADDPNLVESIRRKTIEKLFLAAERKPTALDMVRKAGNEETVMASGKTVFQAMGNKTDQEKLLAVIGPKSYNLMRDYLLWESARERKEELAGGMGIISKGSAIGKFLNEAPGISTANKFVKYKVLSTMLASPKFRGWMEREWKPTEIPELAKTIVVSTPFIEALLDEVGDPLAVGKILKGIKEGVNSNFNQTQEPPQDNGPKNLNAEELLRENL